MNGLLADAMNLEFMGAIGIYYLDDVISFLHLDFRDRLKDEPPVSWSHKLGGH
jgi:hypothetical protein